jgi:hypothetical protein
MPRMQWTIDPRTIREPGPGHASDELVAKIHRLLDARVIVRRSRRVFAVPSWTKHHQVYLVVLTFKDDRWLADCPCDALSWCHHGYAAAAEAERLDGVECPTPPAVTPGGTR